MATGRRQNDRTKGLAAISFLGICIKGAFGIQPSVVLMAEQEGRGAGGNTHNMEVTIWPLVSF